MIPSSLFQASDLAPPRRGSRLLVTRPQPYDPGRILSGDPYDPSSAGQSVIAKFTPPGSIGGGPQFNERRFTPTPEDVPSLRQPRLPVNKYLSSVDAHGIIQTILVNLRDFHDATEAAQATPTTLPTTFLDSSPEEVVGIATPPATDGSDDEPKGAITGEGRWETTSPSAPTTPCQPQPSPIQEHRTEAKPENIAASLQPELLDSISNLAESALSQSIVGDPNAQAAHVVTAIDYPQGNTIIAGKPGEPVHTREESAVEEPLEKDTAAFLRATDGISSPPATTRSDTVEALHTILQAEQEQEDAQVVRNGTETAVLEGPVLLHGDAQDEVHKQADKTQSGPRGLSIGRTRGEQLLIASGETTTNAIRAAETPLADTIGHSDSLLPVPKQPSYSTLLPLESFHTHGDEARLLVNKAGHFQFGSSNATASINLAPGDLDFSPLTLSPEALNEAQIGLKIDASYLPRPESTSCEVPVTGENEVAILNSSRETLRENPPSPPRPSEPFDSGLKPNEENQPGPSHKPTRVSAERACPCPTEVPTVFLMILDGTKGLSHVMATAYAELHRRRLCKSHSQKLVDLEADLSSVGIQRQARPEPRPKAGKVTRGTPKSAARGSTAKKRKQTSTLKQRSSASELPVQGPLTFAPILPIKPVADIPTIALNVRIAPPMPQMKSDSSGEAQRSTVPIHTNRAVHVPSEMAVAPLPAATRGVAAVLEIPIPAKRLTPVDQKSLFSESDHKRQCHGLGFSAPRVGDSVRPAHNSIRDAQYREHVMEELQERIQRDHRLDFTHGGSTALRILDLLIKSKQPNSDPQAGPVDALFLSGDEALVTVEADDVSCPIITESQQPFRWNASLRPIQQLFRRMEDLERSVAVQIPSRDNRVESFESRDLTAVQARFLARQPTDDPWNILDLRSPVPAAILPTFLTGENCQLLPRLRDAVLQGKRAERGSGTRDQWNEWRDVLEWVLLSEGGHNTAPHTDSHGLSTWISVQEGLFGFGWMSNPTHEQRSAWNAKPLEFVDAQWRYVILQPGQTVFFKSGTVHYVFRLSTGQTLALGGHVLQWSGIERWINVVSAQLDNPDMTNEDMEWSAPKYVRVVAELVERRVRAGRAEEMGGEEAVGRLLALLKAFDEKYVVRPLRLKKNKSKKKRTR